jgi:hypothetical protein
MSFNGEHMFSVFIKSAGRFQYTQPSVQGGVKLGLMIGRI